MTEWHFQCEFCRQTVPGVECRAIGYSGSTEAGGRYLGQIQCRCGRISLASDAAVAEVEQAKREQERPPLSRDALLHELARSLRATHPERAEELIAAVEKLLPPPPDDSPGTVTVLHPKQINALIKMHGYLPRGIFVAELAEPRSFDWSR